jgi:hypothetical protein
LGLSDRFAEKNKYYQPQVRYSLTVTLNLIWAPISFEQTECPKSLSV